MKTAPMVVRDVSGNPVQLTFFLILEMPDYSQSAVGVLGGEEASLLSYAGNGSWMTPNGPVLVRDVWEVRPEVGQGPFRLAVPLLAKVSPVDGPPDEYRSEVLGWDGTTWVTERGRVRQIDAPVPKGRTIDDDWDC